MIISNLGCFSHFCNFIVSWMTQIFLLVVRKSYLKQRLTVLKQTQIHGQKQKRLCWKLPDRAQSFLSFSVDNCLLLTH